MLAVAAAPAAANSFCSPAAIKLYLYIVLAIIIVVGGILLLNALSGFATTVGKAVLSVTPWGFVQNLF
jgi:hypothetical protein